MKESGIAKQIRIVNLLLTILAVLLIAKILYDDFSNIYNSKQIAAEPLGAGMGAVEPSANLEEDVTPSVDLSRGFNFSPIAEDELMGAFQIDHTVENRYYSVGETWWDESKVEFHNGIVELNLACSEDAAKDGWHGAQVKALCETGYGLYEVEMKPYVRTPGVVTAFFLYNYACQDEIDIEFNSRNPHRVELNYFAKGVNSGQVGGPVAIDLDFDAFADFHTYGFYYGPNIIVWYIDGIEVYRTDCSETPENVDSKFTAMVNLWAGGNKYTEWLGETVVPEDDSEITAYIKSISYKPTESMDAVQKT